MADTRFYRRCGPFTVSQVAAAAQGRCPESDTLITSVAPLQSAGPTDVSFLDGARYGRLLDATAAGAVIVQAEMADRVPAGATPIVAASVTEAWSEVVRLFHPSPPLRSGRHPTAFVAEGAEVDDTAEIGPFVYIGEGVSIGPRCRIGAHATLSAGVIVGPDCRIGASCTITHTLIGAGSCLHAGVRTGQDGFGLAAGPNGLRTVPHLGRVIIEQDVEIGANCTIDRGSLGDTVIGAGCRIDNLVHIGHNVKIGRCCVLVAQVGIAGSAVLEDFVQVGGQAAIAGHLRVGAHARIGAKSGVMADVEARTAVLGCPAQPKAQFFRQVAWLKRKACASRPAPAAS
ncbi:MAG TPA: UDP-3-O-(3-hydroxymyristoyl)glucosamine N-acyltransferase [Caulobacteraceae bacterium]|nr:UDP-3-O-(3-hydroxymyristoyl)glucosamine N-acyltransferase [Caulobacteraceae bacterium]